MTSTSKAPPRRDYLLVNPEMRPLVTNFEVTHSDTYPTHSLPRMRLTATNVVHHRRILHRPKSLYDLYYDHHLDVYDD